MKKYQAYYREINHNPFIPNDRQFGSGLVSRTVEVPDRKSFSKVKSLAKKATPEGCTFLRVEKFM